jgi:hypothetical protein|tara:strand:- start:3723 stop:4583 length:861 start_codon:yes stop_codon:yes gene_type:complete
MKDLDNLIPDIYAVLEGLNSDVGIDIPEELTEEFLVNMREALDGWSTPHLQSKTIRMSNVGRPIRRVWYDMQDTPETKEKLHPSTFIKFLYGHLLEQIAILLIKLSGHTVTAMQKQVEVDGIKGHMDCKIDGEVVDIKTASNFSFKKFSQGTLVNDDPFGYMAQLAGYEEAEGTEDGGFFAINKETGEICLFRPGQLSKPNIRTRIASIKDSLEKDTPPDICYSELAEGKKGNLRLASGCVYCPHKGKCWKDSNNGVGLRAFKYSNGVKYFTRVISMPKVQEVYLK